MGSARAKAARKMLVKSTPGDDVFLMNFVKPNKIIISLLILQHFDTFKPRVSVGQQLKAL